MTYEKEGDVIVEPDEQLFERLFGVAKAHLWSLADCNQFAHEIFKCRLDGISTRQLEVMEVFICSGFRLS
jgi:hypothetical protein